MKKSLKISALPCQIVLIEDAESDVLLIREAMEHAALVFELQVLGDGEGALELIAKIDSKETVPPPRLIILDLNLPKVSGGPVLARVRDSCSRAASARYPFIDHFQSSAASS
jgi:DNA-binding response OmpR family regulator